MTIGNNLVDYFMSQGISLLVAYLCAYVRYLLSTSVGTILLPTPVGMLYRTY